MATADPGSAFWHAAMQTMFLADSPVGKAVLDRDHRYVLINETLAAFNGRSIKDHIGHTVAEVLPEAYPSLKPLLDQVILGGRAANFRVTLVMPGDGRAAEWEAKLPSDPDAGRRGGRRLRTCSQPDRQGARGAGACR